MADVKISQLPASTLPLAGTEVLPIVQSGTTKKVASDDLTVKNVRSNATTGLLQVAGPSAGTTRVMTTPDANFTAARTDAAQTFTGDQTFSGDILLNTGPAPAETTAGQIAGNGMLILSKAAPVAGSGTLDLTINTDTYFGTPGGFVGTLNVSSTRNNFAVQSRRTTYAVAAYGTTLVATPLASQDGSAGGATFTITMPSNGVIRFTDTVGSDVSVYLSFIGSKSLA